jgi:hypothetical protein
MVGSIRMLLMIALACLVAIRDTKATPVSFACTGKISAQTVVIDLDKGLVVVEGHQTPITTASEAKIEFRDAVLYGVFRLPEEDLAYIAPSGAFTGQCK